MDMSLNSHPVFDKNLVAILLLLFCLIKVDIHVNCGPISNRARNTGAQQRSSNGSSQFNYRRRDIWHLPEPGSAPSRHDYSNHKDLIQFESEEYKERSKVLLPDLDSKGRPKCLSKPEDTYCESVTNYPNITTIKQEIDFTPGQFLEIFGTKEIDGRKSYIDDDLSEERVCRRIPKVIYPQMAKNQANQWVYVVNEVEYTQAVVAEICEKEGKSCAYLDRNLPPGMYSRCRQKYSYKRLLALHPSEKRTYSDKFKFPSCCACYVKSEDILSRSLKNMKNTRRRS